MYKLKRGVKIAVISLTAVFFLLVIYISGTALAITDSYNLILIGRKYISSDQTFVYFFITETSILKKTPEQETIVDYQLDDGIYYIKDFDSEIQALALNKGQEFYLINTNTYMFMILE